MQAQEASSDIESYSCSPYGTKHHQLRADPEGPQPIETQKETYASIDQLALGSIISNRHLAKIQGLAGITRLRTIQNIYISSSERIMYVIRMLESLARVLKLPKDSRMAALNLVRRAIRRKLERNISLGDVVGAAVFLVAKGRMLHRPITLRQISNNLRMMGHRSTFGSLARTLLFFERELGVKLPRIRSENYLPIMLDKISLNRELLAPGLSADQFLEYLEDLASLCRDLLAKLDGPLRGGRNPYAFTASTLYFAGRMYSSDHKGKVNLSQRYVSYVTGVAEYTVREHFSYVKKVMFPLAKNEL